MPSKSVESDRPEYVSTCTVDHEGIVERGNDDEEFHCLACGPGWTGGNPGRSATVGSGDPLLIQGNNLVPRCIHGSQQLFKWTQVTR